MIKVHRVAEGHYEYKQYDITGRRGHTANMVRDTRPGYSVWVVRDKATNRIVAQLRTLTLVRQWIAGQEAK